MKKIFNIGENNKNNQGFSLIELMVSISLIAILTSIIISVANFSETQKNLTLARNELQAVVRLAQSYSLSIPNVGRSDVCGFGVKLDPVNLGQYLVFYTYNTDVTNFPDLCKTDPITETLTTISSEIIKTIKIEDEKLTITGSADDLVFFESPYGDVHNEETFTLRSSGESSGSMTVEIFSSGKIN
jgi:prepilin-type N-terminal cleavage/methylation domain-containing protein